MSHDVAFIDSGKTVTALILITACCASLLSRANSDITDQPISSIGDIQMIGSHNSYKKAMPVNVMALLKWVEPAVA